MKYKGICIDISAQKCLSEINPLKKYNSEEQVSHRAGNFAVDFYKLWVTLLNSSLFDIDLDNGELSYDDCANKFRRSINLRLYHPVLIFTGINNRYKL